MWDGLLVLLFLSIIMGAASFLAGSLPLSFTLSPRQLRLITALGTGVLVGTSLIVIIPEGVETLYASSGASHGHNEPALSMRARESATYPTHFFPSTSDISSRRHLGQTSHVVARGELSVVERGIGWDQDWKREDTQDTPLSSEHEAPVAHNDHSSEDKHEYEPHAWIGISLILGFILMYLIDTLPQTAGASSQPQRFHVNLGQFSFNQASSDEGDGVPQADTFTTRDHSAHSTKPTSRPSSTTVGLVIHAAADGIALGASSTTASSKLSFIIFIALMIHKAPAAFGLTSVLLKQGLSKRMARTHLIVFSLAAPVGALLTWSAVHLLGLSSHSLAESSGTEFVTGVLLLFSGGTFLYVAMHTMQESTGHPHHENHANGYAGVPLNDPYASHASPPSTTNPNLTDTMVTVVGMLLPLLTQVGHGH